MENGFFKAVADVLEVDAVDFETKFRDTEGWCSLQAFGLLVMLENDFHAPMRIDEFQSLATVGELYAHAMLQLFASVFDLERDRLSLDTVCASIPGWNNGNRLRLAKAAEALFDVCYPPEEISSLRTIRDFLFCR